MLASPKILGMGKGGLMKAKTGDFLPGQNTAQSGCVLNEFTRK
jgi:hypothetical protein